MMKFKLDTNTSFVGFSESVQKKLTHAS